MPEKDNENEQLTPDDVAKAAANNIMPENLNAPQRAYWYAMRDLYSDFKRGYIDLKRGEIEKKRLLRLYEADVKTLEEAEDARRRFGKFWKKIEMSAIEYRKNPCVETADAFHDAVYGAGRS